MPRITCPFRAPPPCHSLASMRPRRNAADHVGTNLLTATEARASMRPRRNAADHECAQVHRAAGITASMRPRRNADRNSVVEGKGVSVRANLVVRLLIKTKHHLSITYH